MLFFFLRSLKNLLLFFLKKSFLSLNYYFQAKSLFFHNWYILIIHWHRILWFWFFGDYYSLILYKLYNYYIFYFFKFIGYVILGLIFDLLLNQHIMIYFSIILPWFGLYQMLYLLNNFFDQKVIYDREVLVYHCVYFREVVV